MKNHVINCLGIMLLLLVSIILSSCEKKKSYYSSSYSSTTSTTSNESESTLPKVAIMGCNLGDSIETVEGKLQEKGIVGKKSEKESKNKILNFIDIDCSFQDIPNELTFGNLQIQSLCFRFYNDKLYQMMINFLEPNKADYEEVLGAFKKKYQFPEKTSLYYGPKEFDNRILNNWTYSMYDHKDEYDEYHTSCNKRSDGTIYFDYSFLGNFDNYNIWLDELTYGLGVFDSRAGTEMIKYMKQKKAEGEKSKQDDLF